MAMNDTLGPSLLFWYGQLLSVFKQNARALQVFREVARANPRHQQAWSCIGFMLAERERVALNLQERERLQLEILDEIFGLGPLEPLMKDPEISDILVNTHDNVWIERHGKLHPTDVRFKDDRHLMQVIDRIVSGVGRRIDDSSPMVDARLPDNSTAQAAASPSGTDAKSITENTRTATARNTGLPKTTRNPSIVSRPSCRLAPEDAPTEPCAPRPSRSRVADTTNVSELAINAARGELTANRAPIAYPATWAA